ncbi:MAG: hypothetical protein IPP46_00245 [Bacteroidetes bacterium]|nr:hypothetical protein [Bacteroidota bacterium]
MRTALPKHFFLIILLFLPLFIKASDITIYDVYSNRELLLQSKYKTIKAVQINYYEETDVTYFLLQKSNTPAQQLLQKQLEALALNSWNTELDLLKLYKEVQKRITIYNKLENSNAQGYEYHSDREEIVPRLKDVEMEAISLIDDQLWLSINYTFNIETRNENTTEIDITHYYKASLTTGSLQRFQPTMNSEQQQQVAKILSPYFTSQYLYNTDKLNPGYGSSQNKEIDYEREEGEDEEGIENEKWKITSSDSAIICRQLCEKLNFGEIDFYWYGWGVIAQLQPYTESSSIYDGEGFNILLTEQISDSLRKILPSFSSFKNKKTPASALHNFNYYEVIKPISAVNYAPPIEKLIHQQSIKKIRNLTIESYQLFKNDQKTYRGKYILDYNEKGLLLHKKFIETANSIISDEHFVYDINDRLTQVTGTGYQQQAIFKKYKYNANGNLVEALEISEHNVYKSYFLYNGPYIYIIEQDENTFRDEGIRKLSLINQQLRFATSGYQLNEKNEPVFVTRSKYRFEDVHIGRDSLGRIIESHRENDRYNQYFTYDTLHRFILFDAYEYQRPNSRVEYFYNGTEALPVKQIKTTHQHSTVESEVYTYEFY